MKHTLRVYACPLQSMCHMHVQYICALSFGMNPLVIKCINSDIVQLVNFDMLFMCVFPLLWRGVWSPMQLGEAIGQVHVFCS